MEVKINTKDVSSKYTSIDITYLEIKKENLNKVLETIQKIENDNDDDYVSNSYDGDIEND